MPFDLVHTNILITGAARGLGRLFALKAAHAGIEHIVLWDIDAQALDYVSKEIYALGSTPHAFIVDMTDRQAIETTAAAVNDLSLPGGIDIVINNAGIVRGKYFWEHDNHADTEAIMSVNALAPMYVTQAFLYKMISNPDRQRRILNIASAVSTMANPKMSVYAASKWAVFGWSDSLRLELKQAGLSHIKVTTFCPGYISTGMFSGVRAPLLTPFMTPEEAANAAWKAMIKGTPIVYKPWTVHLAKALRGLLPVKVWDYVAGSVFGVYDSMRNFVGHDQDNTKE
jgi:all-trans-retinol dehydrogenase (NAD+)